MYYYIIRFPRNIVLNLYLKCLTTVQVYQVQVYTGDHWGAATDANMYITIYGSKGDGGKRLLHKCVNNRVKFRRGQVRLVILLHCVGHQ